MSRPLVLLSLFLGVFNLPGLALADQSGDCDCSCPRYFSVLEAIHHEDRGFPEELDQCAAACAIAWTGCEDAVEETQRLIEAPIPVDQPDRESNPELAKDHSNSH